MRKVNFKIRNIGSEKYLSYILDEDCDFDEELLDYLDDNRIPELIDIIYEEDDTYDYLTYDITGRTTVETLLEKTVNAEMICSIIMGVAAGIVNMRDLGIPVSYIILNKGFIYVNPVTYDIKMLCVPIESDVSINAEFKTFVRNLITSVKYDCEEDCNYVARIITFLNADKFTIRKFAARLEDYMESVGMQVESGIDDIDITQAEEDVKATSMDDLPESSDISFGDEEDDGLELYDEEPVGEANNIFADLNLDEDEPVPTEQKAADKKEAEPDSSESESDMTESTASEEKIPESETDAADPFDDSQLTELEIDEDMPEDIPEDMPEGDSEEVQEDAPKVIPEVSGEELTDTLISDDIAGLSASEVSEIADGVTEIAPSEGEQEPELIDINDIGDKPPVVKNIRINRAKIIQAAAEEIEAETTDNPTEQIVSPEYEGMNKEEEAQPEVVNNSPDTETSDATSELVAGEEIPEAPAEKEKPAVNNAVPKAMPYIVRVNTGERVMINKAVFKIGKAARGVDYTVKGNGAISKIHAIISQKEDGVYLQDNKATNTTYVNGVALGEGEEVKLKNDSTIAIGGEDFLFKLS